MDHGKHVVWPRGPHQAADVLVSCHNVPRGHLVDENECSVGKLDRQIRFRPREGHPGRAVDGDLGADHKVPGRDGVGAECDLGQVERVNSIALEDVGLLRRGGQRAEGRHAGHGDPRDIIDTGVEADAQDPDRRGGIEEVRDDRVRVDVKDADLVAFAQPSVQVHTKGGAEVDERDEIDPFAQDGDAVHAAVLFPDGQERGGRVKHRGGGNGPDGGGLARDRVDVGRHPVAVGDQLFVRPDRVDARAAQREPQHRPRVGLGHTGQQRFRRQVPETDLARRGRGRDQDLRLGGRVGSQARRRHADVCHGFDMPSRQPDHHPRLFCVPHPDGPVHPSQCNPVFWKDEGKGRDGLFQLSLFHQRDVGRDVLEQTHPVFRHCHNPVCLGPPSPFLFSFLFSSSSSSSSTTTTTTSTTTTSSSSSVSFHPPPKGRD